MLGQPAPFHELGYIDPFLIAKVCVYEPVNLSIINRTVDLIHLERAIQATIYHKFDIN